MNSIVMNILKMSMYSSVIILVVMNLKRAFGGRLHMKITSLMWIIVLARLLISFTIDLSVNIGHALFKEIAGV